MYPNYNRINQMMSKYQFDALIATDPITVRYLGYNNNHKIFREWTSAPGGGNGPAVASYCLLPYKQDPIYMVSSLLVSLVPEDRENNFVTYGPLRINNPYEEHDSFPSDSVSTLINKVHERDIFPSIEYALFDTLRSQNLSNSRIGIELAGLASPSLDEIQKEMSNCRFIDCTELFRLVRMVKTQEEINALHESCNLLEDLLHSTINTIKDGTNYKQLRRTFQELVIEKEAELNLFIISSKGLGIIENDDFKFEQNRVHFVDASIRYCSYLSDTGMTLFLGKVNNKEMEVYKKLNNILREGLSSLKPGVKCSEVFEAMNKRRLEYDFDNCLLEGHGIGIEHREYPIIKQALNYSYDNGIIHQSADFTIEKNMVINIEVPCYFYNSSSFQIEKTVYITDSGCNELCNQERDSPISLASV
jgi:Xaa-Pro dipeptidase